MLSRLKVRHRFGMLPMSVPRSECMARYKHIAILVVLGWGIVACSGQDEAEQRAKAEEEQRAVVAKEKAVQT